MLGARRVAPARATAIVIGLFAIGLMAGGATGVGAVARARDPYVSLDLFAQVLTTIETDYVDEVPQEALVDAAIQGAVDHLDPHSRWLSAERVAALEADAHGEYYGIGVEVRSTPEGAVVTRVHEGSPAHRDGIQPGDLIVSVDGAPMSARRVEEVSTALQGQRGTDVELSISRAGETTTVTTFRDTIKVVGVQSARIGNVAYLRIVAFQDDVADEMLSAYEKLQAAGPVQGLVVDLRDNPGGLLEQAVAVADLFLDQGILVSTQSRADGARAFEATPGGFPSDLPVVVLVNEKSASASEIVTSALQDTKRAITVGTTTYGKGSVQALYRHENGSALKLTTGRYYTPSGKPVAPREGRVPDVEIPIPGPPTAHDELQREIEALQIDDAKRSELLALLSRIPTPKAEPGQVDWETPPAARKDDVQLQKALQLFTP